MASEEKRVCPKCGSPLIIEVANQKHCNACGHDFDVVKNAVPRTTGSRGFPQRKL